MGLTEFFKHLFAGVEEEAPDVDLNRVQDLVGYSFRRPQLLLLALTHRSYIRNGGDKQSSNERLEFLGDSVLGLVIAEKLFHDHFHKSEGDLTKLKAMLVNESTLAQIGQEISLNAYIRLSPEEHNSGGRERASIISDAFESVIGAVFLDGGFEAARDVVLRLIYTRKDSIITDRAQRNFKGELLELVQARGEGMPRYEIISEAGPDHEKVFDVAVTVSGRRLGEGAGLSKKEAEQKAAAQALEVLTGKSSSKHPH
jgi:ribonuclease-3